MTFLLRYIFAYWNSLASINAKQLTFEELDDNEYFVSCVKQLSFR